MKTKVFVVFHSIYGHVYRMAQSVAEGAGSAEGTEVRLMQVPETLGADILEKMGARQAKKAFEKVPVAKPDELAWADAVIFGTPTRFGNMSAQMRAFLDSTGTLWAQNALVGKIGSVFTSSGTQHGGQESTILSFHITLLHHGMLIAGLPYTEKRQMTTDEVAGGSPYGASTIAGPDGRRTPSPDELAMAKTQGAWVARLASKQTGSKGKSI